MESDEGEVGGCPQCGSTNLTVDEGYDSAEATGAEPRYWRVIRCLECGEYEEF